MGINVKDLPKSFGPYTLKQRFAGGGMAEIYLAETTGPGGFTKPLIIKTIHQAYTDDRRFVSMFTLEAKILSSLTHGHIVPIFDFGNVDGTWYLAMEFIDGVDTATLIDVCRDQGYVIPLDIALHIGIGTAAGLSHAHRAKDATGKSLNIVHRDISPHNILLSRSGEVKLCDFGLATRSIEGISVDAAANDEIKGKLKYLSPEQTQGEAVDFRSDLFSLGVVLYELIAGHHPVPSGAGVSVLRVLAGGTEYPSLASVAPWISPDVCAVVDRALCFDREKRFESAEEMRAALAMCLHHDFPKFSPESLSELVVHVQTVAEEGNGEDDSSITRARIASFASAIRPLQVEGTVSIPPVGMFRRRLVRRIVGAISVAVVVIVGLRMILQLLPGTTSESDSGTQGLGSSDAEQTAAGMDTRAAGPPTDGLIEQTSEVAGARAAILETDDARPDSVGKVEGDTDTASTTESRDSETASHEGGDRERAERRPRGFGAVNINASPWADVIIDGTEYTSTPLLGVRLRSGRHKAVLKNSELGITKTRVFTIHPDETVTLVVEMQGE